MFGWQVSSLTNDFPLIKQKSIDIIARLQEYMLNNIGISEEKQSQMIQPDNLVNFPESYFLPILRAVSCPSRSDIELYKAEYFCLKATGSSKK